MISVANGVFNERERIDFHDWHCISIFEGHVLMIYGYIYLRRN